MLATREASRILILGFPCNIQTLVSTSKGLSEIPNSSPLVGHSDWAALPGLLCPLTLTLALWVKSSCLLGHVLPSASPHPTPRFPSQMFTSCSGDAGWLEMRTWLGRCRVLDVRSSSLFMRKHEPRVGRVRNLVSYLPSPPQVVLECPFGFCLSCHCLNGISATPQMLTPTVENLSQ